MADVAAVTFLLEQVTGVIHGYADLISGAENEFKTLRDDVDILRDILKDAAYKSSEDHGVKLMRNRIREVVYEVEDAIDSWLTESKSKSKARRVLMNFKFAKRVRSLREDKVKEMMEKANAIKRDLASVGTGKEEETQRRRTESVFRQEALVGRKDEIKKITGYLTLEQPELDIISIVGMPGVGKTALAWEIYNCEELQYEFPIRLWVDMSQQTSSRDTLVQIMKHVMTSYSEDVHSMSDMDLHDAIYTCLSGVKFLLVMDDVWNVEQWDQIKCALPRMNGGSKVLITSREIVVGVPYEQLPLDRKESWQLLQQVVFGEMGECPEELQEIGHVISEKCEGVPLTIVVIGSVLKDHYLSLESVTLVKEKWMEMASNVNLALENQGKIIHDAVALSYERLPDRLRDCFLYLGVFPAGFEIPAWTLTRLWIAEGFIPPETNRDLEEIAKSYLNDLISRNLLKVRKVNPMQEVKVCSVQDMIHKFCISEAVKQNMFLKIKMADDTDSLKREMEKINRICLHSDIDKYFTKSLEGPRVRSFICSWKNAIDLEPKYNSVIPKNYPSLRILECKSIIFDQFPQMLTKLNHLRYIVLCVPDLRILPESLSQLWNLQTITVDTHSNSVTMKANLWTMIRLRHVKTKAAIVLDDKWEGAEGDNLQTLNRLSPESVTKAFSRKARSIKTLGVRGELAPLFENMPLGNMGHLEKLKLYQAAASKIRLMCFPDKQRFPPNLRRLTLSNTFLDWKHMSTLAMISDLEVLKLKNNAFTGIQWDASNFVFERLQFLLIVTTDLVLWEALPKTFLCLRHLVLKDCENLKEIPDCVLQRLENLEIDRVRQSAADSARNSGAQFKLTVGSHTI